MKNIITVYKRWKSFWDSNEFTGDCDEIYNAIAKHYSESHRFYHNLDHIKHCLDEYEEIKDMIENKVAFEMAIWFHDIIYDVKAKDNEERSADLASRYAGAMGILDDKLIHDLIMITKSHGTIEKSDFKYLIDIDLAILGVDVDIFREYDENIRREYSWVPKIIYKKKRGKILRSFLNRERLYQTDYFHQKYNKNAKTNLTMILKQY